jgi:AcrR family transcriptional regulator
MAPKRQLIGIFRKKPQQSRADQTVDTIVDATLQILDSDDGETLTTNRIAERAGFSVGTLYQYFKNKDAVIAALMEREMERSRTDLKEVLSASRNNTAEDVVRALIHVLLQRLSGRHRARRALLLMLVRRGDTTRFATLLGEFIEAIFAELRWHDDFPQQMTPMRFRVLTRAVLGAVRLNAIENPAILADPSFEDELVALVLAFGLAPPVKPRPPSD